MLCVRKVTKVKNEKEKKDIFRGRRTGLRWDGRGQLDLYSARNDKSSPTKNDSERRSIENYSINYN